MECAGLSILGFAYAQQVCRSARNDIDVDSMDIAELDELYRDAIDRLDYIEKYVRPQVNKRYSGPNLRQNDVSTQLPSNEDELHENA